MKKFITSLLALLIVNASLPNVTFAEEELNKGDEKSASRLLVEKLICGSGLLQPEDPSICEQEKKGQLNANDLEPKDGLAKEPGAEKRSPENDSGRRSTISRTERLDERSECKPTICDCLGKICFTDGEFQQLETNIIYLNTELLKCKENFAACFTLLEQGEDDLSILNQKVLKLEELSAEKTKQLDYSRKRVAELEGDTWYDYIFYYVIPAALIGSAVYIGADIASDTTHPF